MPGLSRTTSLMRLSCLAVLIAGSGVLSGCYTEGGPGYSADQHVYVSRPWQPYTVTLRDTRTSQEFWSCDVPVGKKLIVKFVDDQGTNDQYTPDLMSWALVDEDRETGVSLASSIPVPPANARRLETVLRSTPELPESMVQTTRGTLAPAKRATVRPPTVTATPAQPSPVGATTPTNSEPASNPSKPEAPIQLPDSPAPNR